MQRNKYPILFYLNIPSLLSLFYFYPIIPIYFSYMYIFFHSRQQPLVWLSSYYSGLACGMPTSNSGWLYILKLVLSSPELSTNRTNKYQSTPLFILFFRLLSLNNEVINPDGGFEIKTEGCGFANK